MSGRGNRRSRTPHRGRQQGRGRGRGRGGGRGRGKQNHNNNNRPKEMKFAPSVGSKNKATYQTIKEHLINKIQKDYDYGDDMAKCIKRMEMINLTDQQPTKKYSTKENADAKALEQSEFNVLYEKQMDIFVAREEELCKNTTKIYSLIIESYCTTAMVQRLKEHKEFYTKIKDNPIELLKAIQVLMHSSTRATYPFAEVTETLLRFLHCKQNDKSLLDYVGELKDARDSLKSLIGDKFFDEFIEKTDEYKNGDDATKEELKKNAFEQWTAYLTIKNSDKKKYGTLKDHLISQFSMNHDQYPRKITAAVDILSNHRHDNSQSNTQQNTNRQQQQNDPNNNNNNNNNNSNEQSSTTVETSFAQTDFNCFCCGKTDHIVQNCPKRNTIPRNQWFINRAFQNMQQHDNNNNGDEYYDDQDDQSVGNQSQQSHRSNSRSQRGWAGCQLADRSGVHLTQQNKSKQNKSKQNKSNESPLTKAFTDLSQVILIDTGSSSGMNTMANPDMVTDITISKQTLNMKTNAGDKTLNMKAMVPEYKQVWFNQDGIANIFAFADVADKYRVTYDSKVKDAFFVHFSPDHIVQFNRTPEGLYAYKPSQQYLNTIADMKGQSPPPVNRSDTADSAADYSMISTVKKNMEGFTSRQVARAKAARKLYHIMHAGNEETFKTFLRMPDIKNCPLVNDDISNAQKMFGKDVAQLKGSGTRKRPTPIEDNIVEIPQELIRQHHKLELCTDIMYINGQGILTSIDRTIRFRCAIPVPSKHTDEYYKALDAIFRLYNNAGFLIKTIYCDPEFKPLMDDIKDDLRVDMKYSSAGDHVPEAERNNRSIADKYRTAFHCLPYRIIPHIMARHLVMDITEKMNAYPAKGGISEYYSPNVIMGGIPWDYKKHCQIEFGAYVQANYEAKPYNTPAPRTIDAIYLCPIRRPQGGHELMDLNTGRKITRPVVHEVPITQMVIQAVESLAEARGIKQNYKFTNRHGILFYPANWIAGVDYNNLPENIDEENDDDYDPDEDDEDDDEYYDEDEDDYDRVDQDELDELLADDSNPTDSDTQQDLTDDDSNQEPEVAEQPQPVRASTRVTRQPDRISPTTFSGKSYAQQQQKKKVQFSDEKEWQYNLFAQVHPNPNDDAEYSEELAPVIAAYMIQLSAIAANHGASFAQQYILQKGLKIFKERGVAASEKELDQLHNRECFEPISISDLTPSERSKAQEALMFLTKKRDKSIKGRMVYNGKPTRLWLSREDSASPTVANESLLLTATIDAKENRDIMTNDLPNAFIQTLIPEPKEGEERVIMKITGVLVDMLTKLAPETYANYVVFEKGNKVLYVIVKRAIYGMLQAALLHYRKLRGELEGIGFKFNPYDPCVANRKVHGSQHTVRFHVDDLMSSHRKPKVNDQFEKWLNSVYGNYGKVKAVRGKVHEFLGMTFDFREKGKVKIDMKDYVSNMVDDFPLKFKPDDIEATPAADDLFSAGKGPLLDKNQKEQFHTTVAKGLFVCKRARPDIHETIAVLCTRTQKPNESDWKKLLRLLKYCNGTRDDVLILSADNLRVIKWYIDAAFAVHPDFRSHTGGVMTLGRGAIQSISTKQKLNTRSSTEAELVGTDDESVLLL